MKNRPGSDAENGVMPFVTLSLMVCSISMLARPIPSLRLNDVGLVISGKQSQPDRSDEEDEPEDTDVLDADQEPEVTQEDLELDDDENHDMVDGILSSAQSLADDIMDS